MNLLEDNKPAHNPWGTGKRLLAYYKPYIGRLIIVIILLTTSSVTNIIGLMAIKPAINDYLLPLIGQNPPDLSQFARFVVGLGMIYAIGVVASYIYDRLMVSIGTQVLYDIRSDLFQHMQTLPLHFFDTHAHGELMSRFTNDTDTLREFFSLSLAEILSAFISITAIVGVMLYSNLQLSLIVLGMMVIMIIVIQYLGKKSKEYYTQQQEAIGKVNGYLEEMIEGQKVVKVFNHQQATAERFVPLNHDQQVAATGSIAYANYLFPILMNLSYVTFGLVAMAGSLYSIQMGLDLGTIGSFLQFTRNLSQPLSQMSQHFNTVIRALAGGERIFTILDQTPEIDEGDVVLVPVSETGAGGYEETNKPTKLWAWKRQVEGATQYRLLKGDITFHGVSFGYEADQPVLKGIDIEAKSGQKVALVGSTGAGKTTIINLLNRFYEVDKGEITFDDIPISHIRKKDLRQSLSMVLQDTHLFTDTVQENIRYGDLDASDKQVEEAAAFAHAQGFIRSYPGGYKGSLSGGGETLSQGQRQLLSIARVAISDPQVLILDEATSSVDTRTEQAIGQGMEQLMKDRTSFVIAHRLSTIEDADMILVLEDGKIIERGNHQELLGMKGRYYQLYTGLAQLT